MRRLLKTIIPLLFVIFCFTGDSIGKKKELIVNGFSFDAPPGVMIHLSNPSELKIKVPFTKYLINKISRLSKEKK